MPINANIIIGNPNYKVIELLNRCGALDIQKDHINSISYSVTELFLKKNIYGHLFEQSKALESFLASFNDLKIILIPESCSVLGKLNLDFIRFIKDCSMESKTKVVIVYEHERGDWLYELARWSFLVEGNLEETLEIDYFCGTDRIIDSAQFELYQNGKLVMNDFKRNANND